MISEVDIQDMKDLNGYQEAAWGTAMESARNSSYLYNGLAGESGEVCEVISSLLLANGLSIAVGATSGLHAKAIRDGISDPAKFTMDLKKELGDCLWFISGLAKMSGLTLQEVAEANIEKLYSRKQRGTIGGSGNDR